METWEAREQGARGLSKAGKYWFGHALADRKFEFSTWGRSSAPSLPLGSSMLACAVYSAAAAAAAPFKHAPLPPVLVELRDTLQDALANPGLRDALADLHPLACLRRCREVLIVGSRDALRTLTVVDTSLHAATMGTVTGLEVLCGSIRACHRSMRGPTSRTPQLKTGRVVCALCAGARCVRLVQRLPRHVVNPHSNPNPNQVRRAAPSRSYRSPSAPRARSARRRPGCASSPPPPPPRVPRMQPRSVATSAPLASVCPRWSPGSRCPGGTVRRRTARRRRTRRSWRR